MPKKNFSPRLTEPEKGYRKLEIVRIGGNVFKVIYYSGHHDAIVEHLSHEDLKEIFSTELSRLEVHA